MTKRKRVRYSGCTPSCADLDIGSDVSVSAGCSTDSLTLSYTATIPSKYLHGEINIEYQCDNSSKQIVSEFEFSYIIHVNA